jgi:hypothetical protein
MALSDEIPIIAANIASSIIGKDGCPPSSHID